MPSNPKKRVKKSQAESMNGVTSVNRENIPSDKQAPGSTEQNRKGLLSLPHELVLMLLAYFPEIQLEHILANPYVVNKYGSPNFYVRFVALRALSQTCRLARKIYLPFLWERFHVCLAADDASWFRTLGKALERKSRGMLESPELWHYVKVVTVSITRYQTATVLPPFVELLRALPNVHTIEIPHAHSAITGALKTAFEGSIFPTIRKVIMPTCAHEILRCCPSVEDVTCNEDDGGRLLDALAHAGCSKLEVIRDIIPGPTMIKRFIKAAPRLRCIRIKTGLKEHEIVIQACSGFPTLRILEIHCEEGRSDVDHLVDLAQKVLRAAGEYKPPTKTRKSRGKTTNAERSLSEQRDMYSDPKIVRVFYFPKLPNKWSKMPTHCVPVRVVDFPV